MSVLYGKNPCLEYLRVAQGKAAGYLYIARQEGCPYAREAGEYARALGLTIVMCSRHELNSKYAGLAHQGFVLELAQGSSRNTPARNSVAEYDWQEALTRAIEQGKKPKVLILDQVQDPGNLGAIVRSAALFGIACVFIPRDKAALFTEAARKSASGGENFVPVVRVANLARLLDQLKQMGFWIAAATSDAGAALAEFDFNSPYAVILGSEGRGIRRLLLDKADHFLRIPTNGCLNSLNVSVAAGIIMYAMYGE